LPEQITSPDNTLQAARRPVKADWVAGGLLVILTLFRFWYDAHHELLQDEAYYWQWSRHLDWGYYDNTPLMAPVIRFSTSILGQTELGVRAGSTLASVVISVFIYLLARRLLGTMVALVSVVLANTIPLFAAGSVIMTQDPFQIAFWAATLYAAHRALTDRPRWWYGVGILAGLAAQAKLNALLLFPSLFLYLLLSPTARSAWLRRPEPYLAGLIALLVLSPFFWWNQTHQNAFWLHAHAMGSRGSGHDGAKWALRFLGDQAILLSPLIFLTYLYTLVDGGRRGIKEKDDAVLYLWCPSIVTFTAIFATALRSKVEGNWAVAAYLTGIILVAAVLVRLWENGRAVGRVWVGLSAFFAVVLALVAYFPALVYGPFVVLHRPLPKFLAQAVGRTNEFYGWRQLADRVAQEQSAMGGDPFVFGINYRMPSEVAFYLPGKPQTYSLFLSYRASEYMFWENPSALIGRNAVFIHDVDAIDPEQKRALQSVFTRVEAQPPLCVYRNPPYTKPIRTIQIVRCYGFKGYETKRWQDGW